MGPTEWTVISTGLVIIIANAASFRSLPHRDEQPA